MNKTQLLSYLSAEGFPLEIVKAFEKVPREKFLPDYLINRTYEDIALPLEKGATISQPYTIAFMLNLLDISQNKSQKILEIGSGCGYVLALLSELSPKSEIYGIEIIKSLAEKSKRYLHNYKKIKVINKNGFRGLKSKAPFDRILISAAAEKIPEHLYPQLKDKGVIISPVKDCILKIIKNKKLKIERHSGFVFIPLKEED